MQTPPRRSLCVVTLPRNRGCRGAGQEHHVPVVALSCDYLIKWIFAYVEWFYWNSGFSIFRFPPKAIGSVFKIIAACFEQIDMASWLLMRETKVAACRRSRNWSGFYPSWMSPNHPYWFHHISLRRNVSSRIEYFEICLFTMLIRICCAIKYGVGASPNKIVPARNGPDSPGRRSVLRKTSIIDECVNILWNRISSRICPWRQHVTTCLRAIFSFLYESVVPRSGNIIGI